MQTIEKKAFINTVSAPPKKQCSQCGKPYYRRNLIEVWTGRNPGKRLGWGKEIAKVCLNCQDVQESARIIGIADVQFAVKTVVRKKK